MASGIHRRHFLTAGGALALTRCAGLPVAPARLSKEAKAFAELRASLVKEYAKPSSRDPNVTEGLAFYAEQDPWLKGLHYSVAQIGIKTSKDATDYETLGSGVLIDGYGTLLLTAAQIATAEKIAAQQNLPKPLPLLAAFVLDGQPIGFDAEVMWPGLADPNDPWTQDTPNAAFIRLTPSAAQLAATYGLRPININIDYYNALPKRHTGYLPRDKAREQRLKEIYIVGFPADIRYTPEDVFRLHAVHGIANPLAVAELEKMRELAEAGKPLVSGQDFETVISCTPKIAARPLIGMQGGAVMADDVLIGICIAAITNPAQTAIPIVRYEPIDAAISIYRQVIHPRANLRPEITSPGFCNFQLNRT